MTDSAFVTNYITIVLNLIKYIFKISTFMHSCEERSIRMFHYYHYHSISIIIITTLLSLKER